MPWQHPQIFSLLLVTLYYCDLNFRVDCGFVMSFFFKKSQQEFLTTALTFKLSTIFPHPGDWHHVYSKSAGATNGELGQIFSLRYSKETRQTSGIIPRCLFWTNTHDTVCTTCGRTKTIQPTAKKHVVMDATLKSPRSGSKYYATTTRKKACVHSCSSSFHLAPMPLSMQMVGLHILKLEGPTHRIARITMPLCQLHSMIMLMLADHRSDPDARYVCLHIKKLQRLHVGKLQVFRPHWFFYEKNNEKKRI